jgi:tight adherence protein C
MAFLAQWPTLLESMAVAVSAGMDLLHAFEICVARTHGPLRESLEKVVVRLHSGMSLPAALAAMEKDGIDEARRLRATLAQAESLGTPVASVLEALAAEYYTSEKQRFESKLNSLPVKLSVITVIFLLPPVLIISVMPHVLSFIGAGW